MLNEMQSQKAGDNANQFQAETVNVYNTTNVIGITEDRAREIIEERIQTAIQDYSKEAQEIAHDRIDEYTTILIPKLVREQLLDSLKDPSVQLLLVETEKAATASGNPKDYELLSELLIHRVKKGDDRNVMVGVNHAIKIVDEISDEALQGLTIAHSIETFIPVRGKIKEGIKLLDDLFSKMLYDELPSDEMWIEHLDILNAVRINPFGSMKKVGAYYAEVLSGYVDVGIRKDSENYSKAVDILKSAKVPLGVLVDHELREGYVRLELINKSRPDLLPIAGVTKINIDGQLIEIPVKMVLSEKIKNAIEQVYDLYDDNVQYRNENIAHFLEILRKCESLRKVEEWWDSLNGSFSITTIGKVLAHANAQRCNPCLPPLS